MSDGAKQRALAARVLSTCRRGRSGGGGGWADPLERDAAPVADDVAEGLISAAAAHKLHGVALRGNLSLDETGTQRLRDRLRSSRKGKPRSKTKKKPVRKAKGRRP